MATAFPIKNNTIRINFVDLCDQLFVSIIDVLLIEGIVDGINRVWWALINKNLGALFCLLLNRSKECIVSSMFRKCDYDSYSLFLCIVGFDVESGYALVAFTWRVVLLVVWRFVVIFLLLAVAIVVLVLALSLFPLEDFVAHWDFDV